MQAQPVTYRGLNKVKIKNRYLLPLIAATLDRLSGTKIFLKLALKDISELSVATNERQRSVRVTGILNILLYYLDILVFSETLAEY